MDLSNFIPKEDVTVVEIKHPITGEVLKTDEGETMAITVYLPHSKEYRAVVHSQTNARIQRAQKTKGVYTSEEIEQATIDLIVNTTKDWNVQFNKTTPKFSAEACRDIYDKLPWVRAQVLQAQEDFTSFLKV
jgi:hypothetical protein